MLASEEESRRRAALEDDIQTAGFALQDYPCAWDAGRGTAVDLSDLELRLVNDLEASIRKHHAEVRVETTDSGFWTRPAALPPEVPTATAAAPPEATLPVTTPPPTLDQAVQAPKVYDENVQFTVYLPQAVEPQRWYTLLAFAHLSERPPDAEESEPDPVEAVDDLARQILGEEFDSYRDMSEDSAQAVPRKAS